MASNRSKRSRVGCLILLFLLALAPLINGVQYLLMRHSIRPLQSHLPSYLAGKPVQVDLSHPYLKAKVVIVDVTRKDFDADLTLALPSELRARDPSEVRMRILADWSTEEVGRYQTPGGGNGTPALVHHCTITLIDLGRNTVVGEQAFRGSDPPPSRTNSGSSEGTRPTREVIDFLNVLPRQ